MRCKRASRASATATGRRSADLRQRALPSYQAISLAMLLVLVLVASGCTSPIAPTAPAPSGNFTAPTARPAPEPYTGEYPLLYEHIRFGKMPITVHFDAASGQGVPFFSGDTVDAARAALLQWEEETNGLITFKEVASAGQAQVLVHWQTKLEGEHTLGLGGPTVIDTGRYNVTIKGDVTLASMETFCLNTVVALHELGHVLGLDHPEDPESFMYRTATCEEGFTPQILETMELLYADPARAELELTAGNVSVVGRFLFANVTVLNSGLLASEPTSIALMAGTEKVTDVQLPQLEPGTYYRIQVTDGAPKSLNGLIVRIDPANAVQELDEANNAVPLAATSS